MESDSLPPYSSVANDNTSLDSTGSPPPYEQIINAPPLPSVPPLHLDRSPGLHTSSTVTNDQCIAHLKLLAALADLRDSISAKDGLFGINDAEASLHPTRRGETLARIREKRWSVYTARAVERYSAWWTNCLPCSKKRPTVKDLLKDEYNHVTERSLRLSWKRDNMPPLGE